MKKTTFAKFLKDLGLTWESAATLMGFSVRKIGYLLSGKFKLNKLELHGLQYLWECHLYKTKPRIFGEKNKD